MNNKLIHGDSVKELNKFEDNSVDLLCTDPPYGYGFMGRDWDKVLPDINIFKECFRVLKPGSMAFVMSAPRSDVQYRMAEMLEKVGFRIDYTPIYWTYASGFPKAMNMGKMLDKVGRDKKELDGSYAGFQPKPAVEVVIVAMKPLDKKGYLEQAQDNQKGITWFDDCRIPFEESDTPKGGYGAMDIGIGKPGETQDYRKKKKITMPDLRDVGKKSKEAIGIDKLSYGQVENAERLEYEQNTDGRFPANLLVSDNVLDDGKITNTNVKAGIRKAGNEFGQDSGWNDHTNVDSIRTGISDSGGYSRYFNLDAWWNKNIKSLPEPVQQTFPFMIVPKASRSEKDNGLDRNIHPTVKPLTLMNYLVTLGSRKGDVVLEPFAGSGTTALACVGQERDYIAIEREQEYYEIAKARLEKVEQPLKLWEKFSG